MQVHRVLPQSRILEACALTVGSFDGVHRGHQMLVERLQAEAQQRNLATAALTFEDLPYCFFSPDDCPKLLTLADEKIAAFQRTGLDHLFIVPFTQAIAQTGARAFMEAWCQIIGLKLFLGGPDFALGKGREGTIPQLQAIGHQLGFEAIALDDKLIEAGAPISSTRCRNLFDIGEVELAHEFLGYPVLLMGEVVAGDQLGRQIGVPTINLRPDERKIVPAHGVYAVRAHFNGQIWPAAMNIGIRPTVNGTRRQIEFHVLDENIELAPEKVKVEFVARLRSERKFKDLDELVTQMKRDFQAARAMLGT